MPSPTMPESGLVQGVAASLLSSVSATVRGPVEDLLGAGGKHLRPRFYYASSERRVDHRVAAAIELTHVASLLHDDVVDRAGARRGVAVPARDLAARAGVAAVAAAAQVFIDQPRLARGFGRMLTRMAEGQVLDAARAHAASPSVEALEDIFRLKTGALFGFAAETACIVDGRPEVAASHAEAGELFGTAFQIRNDVLSRSSAESADADARIGIASYPAVWLAESGSVSGVMAAADPVTGALRRADELVAEAERLVVGSALSTFLRRQRQTGATR